MMKNAEGDEILIPEGESKVWNYHPNLPVPNSPVFLYLAYSEPVFGI